MSLVFRLHKQIKCNIVIRRMTIIKIGNQKISQPIQVHIKRADYRYSISLT